MCCLEVTSQREGRFSVFVVQVGYQLRDSRKKNYRRYPMFSLRRRSCSLTFGLECGGRGERNRAGCDTLSPT